MGKHSVLDIKQTSNSISPITGFVRLRVNGNKTLEVIYDDNRKRTITHAWELPVEDVELLDPSTITPNPWDKYLIPANAVGDWAGHDQDIATWNNVDNTWEFVTPEKGFGAYVKSKNIFYNFDGAMWVPLQAGNQIIDITYDDLRLTIRNAGLIPGKLYRLTDYHSINAIRRNSDIMHTSPEFMLLFRAVSNTEIDADCIDLSNVNDAITYTPSMGTNGFFYLIWDSVNNTEVDSDGSLNDGSYFTNSFAPYFETVYIDDTHFRIGTDVVIRDPLVIGASISVYEGTDYTYDKDTGIITLINGHTFNEGNGTYWYINMGGLIPALERRRGKITHRTDNIQNIDIDMDWRNVAYALRKAETDYENVGTPWYCSAGDHPATISDSNIYTIGAGSTRQPLFNIDNNDYEIRPFMDDYTQVSSKNVKMTDVRYTIMEHMSITELEAFHTYESYWHHSNIYRTKLKYASSFYMRAGASLSTFEVDTRASQVFITGNMINVKHVSIDRCVLHNIQSITDDLSLWHVQQFDSSNISNTKGHLSFLEMHGTSHIRNSDLTISHVMMDTSHIDDLTNSLNSISMFLIDHTDISNSHFKITDQTEYIEFVNRNIHDVIWMGSMLGTQGVGNALSFPQIQSSDVTGIMPEEAFTGMVIDHNTITHDNNFLLPTLNINADIDASSNIVSLELPGNPYQGMNIRITDIIGNAQNNNIHINVSSSPAGGVVNTINGTTSKAIDKRYGVLVIRYSETGGWVVVQETIIQTPETEVDDITIEKENGYRKRSTQTTDNLEISANWQNTYPTSNWVWYSDFKNSTHEFGAGTNTLFEYTSSTSALPPMDAGTIRFYASAHFTQDPLLYDYNANVEISPSNVSNENELVIYEYNLSGGEKIGKMYVPSYDTQKRPITLYMIDKYAPTPSTDLTIKGIGRIIGSSGLSIDGSATLSQYPDREIPTVGYVDTKVSLADEVTISRKSTESEICKEQDPDLYWDGVFETENNLNNQDWTIDSGVTYDINGVFTFTFPGNGTQTLISQTPSSSQIDHTPFLVMYTNTQIDPWVYQLRIITDDSYVSAQYDEIDLGNGWYSYKVQLPNHINFRGMEAFGNNIGSDISNFQVSFIDMSTYPALDEFRINEIDYIIGHNDRSVDSSHTHTTDSNREIATKLYVDRNDHKLDDVTISEDKIFDVSSSPATHITRSWDFRGVSVSQSNGTYADGIFSSDGSDIIDIDFTTTEIQSGVYGIWTSDTVPTSDITLSLDGVSITRGLEMAMYGGYASFFSYVRGDVTGNWNLHIEGSAPITSKFIPIKDSITIEGIDHIIDDNGISIDDSNTPMTDPHKELATRAFIESRSITADSEIDVTIGPGGDYNNFEEFEDFLNGVVISPTATIKATVLDGTHTFDVQSHGHVFKVPDFITVLITASALGNVTINVDNSNGYAYRSFISVDFSANTKIENLHIIDTVGGLTHISCRNQGVTEVADCILENGRYAIFARMFAQVLTRRVTIKNIDSRAIWSVESSRVDVWDTLSIDGCSIGLDASVQSLISLNGTAQVDISNAGYGVVAQLNDSSVSIVTNTQLSFTNISQFEYAVANNSKIIASYLDLSSNTVYPNLNIVNDDFSYVFDNQQTDIRYNTMVYINGFGVDDIATADKNVLVTREYVDINNNKKIKVIATSNIALSGLQVIDGVSVVDGDRVAVIAQTNSINNGFYIANSGSWTRSDDMLVGSEVAGVMFIVQQGNSHADSLWCITNDTGTDVIGTDNILFKLMSSGSFTKTTERHIIDATDEANQYLDLLHTPEITEHIFVYINGMYADMDPNGDYTISGNRLSFVYSIQQDDKVIVKYSYL
jgi:hypothetical protein